MRRRPATLAATLLGAAATVLTFTLAAQAAPGAGSAPGGPAAAVAPDGIAPEMFAALQRDLRLTPAQARARLDADARAGRAQQVLSATLGSRYGGTWVAGDGAVAAGVTTAADAATARALGVVPVRVRHGEQALTAVVDRLNQRAEAAPEAVVGWYADLPTNSVVVLARPGGGAAAEAFAAGAPAGTVRVQASTENPRPYADVIGGNAYYIGSSRCSVGFSVQGGFVTAGHCGRTGARTSQPGGTFRGSTFPGRDYAWVQVDAGNTPRGLVNQYNGGTVAVAGSTEAAVGAAVCRSGSTTGWRCGTIQQKNASVTYPEGTVSGLTRSNACAEPGDSGGSWLAGAQAQGVTSGGSGNCTSGGTMYFQPVNPILAAYGLSLITSGGGPDPTPTPTGTGNPPGDTTWQAGTPYAAGATVTYGGQSYRCLQAHTAQAGWEPPTVPALWQRV
ncbi:Alpha-lytic protease precursor [Micromonospora sp. MW-13]|uniref:carbohydrate-binding protein n=1 Tax=unclassified Micromonospora TaxID=2617518 RepID=UPI000E44DE26|nr:MULTISPECIES: carbohydrate-binding protein [unclassified Micromonospora]MCX4471163.1 alpha-lytic protease prodomain-containing protein [Micromonospora sp. NBC_01655]RGC67114.1 Alpha-lytic protease precursor [Micromonospora sp. MW-13]